MNQRTFARIAMIAAIYTVLCLTPVLSAIAYGPVQVRIAEALTLLPLLWKPSIWGVTLGCFLSNLIGAATGINPTGLMDAVWGTIATFGAAYCTWLLRNYRIGTVPVWSCLMPVVWNFFIIGAELAVLLMPDNLVMGTLINGTYVAIGELIAVIFGYLLIRQLEHTHLF
ncbi:MAG: QueT transporter family protein [Solobacterium sp.]|nr:QueT transporter family protein [Solobacterium sp.]